MRFNQVIPVLPAAGVCPSVRLTAQTEEICFIGNSFTCSNDVPGTFQNLTAAGDTSGGDPFLSA